MFEVSDSVMFTDYKQEVIHILIIIREQVFWINCGQNSVPIF
jgi:hypothetical protein